MMQSAAYGNSLHCFRIKDSRSVERVCRLNKDAYKGEITERL